MKVSKMLIALVLICATNFPTLKAQEQHSNQNATVYLLRPPLVAGGVGFRFYDAEKYLGKTTFGKFIKYECEPGMHHFGVLIKDLTGTFKPDYFAIDLKPNETYYLKAVLKDKEDLKSTLKENKKERKLGNKKVKQTFYHIVNLESDPKELEKTKKKVSKKDPETFSKEEIIKGHKEYSDDISSAFNNYISEYNGVEVKRGVAANTSVNSANVANLVANLKEAEVETTAEVDYNKMSIEELEAAKEKAISNEKYLLADSIKKKIKAKKDFNKNSVEQLTELKKTAISDENYLLADSINKQILIKEALAQKLEDEANSTELEVVNETKTEVATNNYGLVNKREVSLNEILAGKNSTKRNSTSYNTVTTTNGLGEIVSGKTKIKKSEANKTADGVKYRRSSLYTLMIKNDGREHSSMIKNTFGNFELPQKFNDHNIGPYLIDIEYGEKDQSRNISNYLSTNEVAKQMVAKWFNRSADGGFNMDLIAERGKYSASDLDIKLAKNQERGMSVIEDAGEELIKNTFIVVNDYKFTNKEEVAKKAGGFLKIVAKVASYAGYSDVANVANLTSAGVGVVGKGYVIKTTAYLYQLEWNEKTAAIFYNDHWTEDGAIDMAKKEAFEKSDIFKLKLIGSQSAFADLQSTIFTKKSNEGLIEIATIKATNKSIAKLQKKFEEFRTKSPLLSGDPISAKIGLKEGVEKGDKFEVLEQVINKHGKTEYKRVGVVKVDKNQIWDNRYMVGEEKEDTTILETLYGGAEPKKEFTTFSGPKNKFFSGMLIRQIN